jgi:signal transduction histidine kinase/GAF domain-containing protein
MDAQRHSLPSRASSPEENASRLQLLIDTGLQLAGERNLDVIVQTALDAALLLACARFAAFFYKGIDPDGNHLPFCKLAAEYHHLLAGLSIVPVAGLSVDRFPEPAPVCSGDISGSPSLRTAPVTESPFLGTPFANFPIRSYMAVPVLNATGEHLGSMIFGHPDPDIFSDYNQSQVSVVASQASSSIENARLAQTLTHEIALADSARQLQRDSARRLRQALDSGKLGTWTWNRVTDMLDLDERAAELFDAEPHVPISRTELRKRIVHEDDLAATAENLHDVLVLSDAYIAEYRVDNRDGRQYWVCSRGVATFDDLSSLPSGVPASPRELTGMIGTVQDVTTRKTQEAALRQSEKLAATGRLAATIAHEINNPLEAVTNLIYLSKTDPGVPSPIQHLLHIADSELSRVSQIAQQTLGFYRDTTRPVDINLTQLLEGVVNLFSRKMEYKKLHCTLDLATDLHIFGLQGEIRQVFSNLVVNAIDASSNGLIQLRARRRTHNGRPGVSVLVSDHGTGIPVSARPQVFFPFFTTKQSVGTGLGLWVTRGIVEKQGGTIRVRTSTELPSGTVFRVFLPTEVTS